MKLFILLLAIIPSLAINSCSTSRESGLSGDQRVFDEAMIRQAVESRKFIIKLDRIYSYGGMIDLRPRSNYIIVDGRYAVINAAYFGRQYDIRPISGINMRGVAMNYEVTDKISKGMYEITMKVGNEANTFDVYLTIGKNGTADASVNSLKIQNARYRGYVVPLAEISVPLQPENGMI